ncbi:SBBP repeat-containing protein [Thermodesulfobacteriota bacterium]
MRKVLFLPVLVFILAISFYLSACGGSSGSSYTVGGTVTGLTGTVVLQLNGGNDLTITEDGEFTFPTGLDFGDTYIVTVLTQPDEQICTLLSRNGTIAGANVTDVTATCSASAYTVGGTVTGLTGTVVLQINGADDLTITSNGAFTFPTPLAEGSNYHVSVLTQPTEQTCTLSSRNGEISGANVTDVTATCSTFTYSLSGTVSNLTGTLVLQVNGGDDLTITSSGAFTFPTELAAGAPYDVTILTQPVGQRCILTNSSGTMPVAAVTDVAVLCFDPGVRDTTFGVDGVAVHNSAAGGNSLDIGYSITIDTAGRILVTGYSWNGSANYDMVIWRYLADGTIDTTFGTSGVAVHHNAAGGNSTDYGWSITVDSAGRILVTGSSKNVSANNDMVIWRYLADGTIDTTFGSSGVAVHNNAAGGNSHDDGQSITIDSAGRILVAGYSKNVSANNDMVIWRYLADGTLDTTFGTSGVALHNSAAGGNSHDYGLSITIDTAGRILVTGYSYNLSGNADMVIWRYLSDGTIDTTFGTSGVAVHHNASGGNSLDYGRSITIDTAGKILVTGYSRNASANNDMVIWRYLSDGTIDTTFGTSGVVVDNSAAGGYGDDIGWSITVDSTGRILVTGQSYNLFGNADMVIWRYLADGTIDTTFGTSGVVVDNSAAGGYGDDIGWSITVDSTGRVLVCGSSKSPYNSTDMVIWRYHP